MENDCLFRPNPLVDFANALSEFCNEVQIAEYMKWYNSVLAKNVGYEDLLEEEPVPVLPSHTNDEEEVVPQQSCTWVVGQTPSKETLTTVNLETTGWKWKWTVVSSSAIQNRYKRRRTRGNTV